MAVPPIDDYGKIRTCAYLPIGTIKYDNNGKVIPYNLEDGFSSDYVQEVIYNGITSTEDNVTYSMQLPDIPEINKNTISQDLINIANQAIKDKLCH